MLSIDIKNVSCVATFFFSSFLPEGGAIYVFMHQ